MRLFNVSPDQGEWENRNYIEAVHKWKLPGVKCTICGDTWSTTGLAYPSVDLSVLQNAERYTNSWPVSLSEFDELRQPILPLMPDGSIPPPGTQFGPLLGKAEGTFGDFAWVNPWTILIRKEAYDSLMSAGVSMPKGIRPILLFTKANPVDLLELEIEPHAVMAQSSLSGYEFEYCSGCGRVRDSLPERIKIEGNSIPRQADLFRIRNFSTAIIATEKFLNTVKEFGLSDITFREADLEKQTQ